MLCCVLFSLFSLQFYNFSDEFDSFYADHSILAPAAFWGLLIVRSREEE